MHTTKPRRVNRNVYLISMGRPRPALQATACLLVQAAACLLVHARTHSCCRRCRHRCTIVISATACATASCGRHRSSVRSNLRTAGLPPPRPPWDVRRGRREDGGGGGGGGGDGDSGGGEDGVKQKS